jgi:hypothetical protein
MVFLHNQILGPPFGLWMHNKLKKVMMKPLINQEPKKIRPALFMQTNFQKGISAFWIGIRRPGKAKNALNAPGTGAL